MHHHKYAAPMGPGGNLEAVVFGEVHAVGGNGRRPLLIIHVRNALEKEQGEDVRLEVGSVHRAAQDVRRFPEVGFELGEGDRLLRHMVPLFPSNY